MHTYIPYQHTYMQTKLPFTTYTYACTQRPNQTATYIQTTYIQTYKQTCKHTYIHTYIHACIHTHIHTYIHIHTYLHTYIRTCIHTYILTYIHTYIQTYRNTDDDLTNIHSWTRIRTRSSNQTATATRDSTERHRRFRVKNVLAATNIHGVLQCVAVCCSVLQCVAVCVVCCSAWWQRRAKNILSATSIHGVLHCCSVLQCVAVCCSVLQCVQCVAVCGQKRWIVLICKYCHVDIWILHNICDFINEHSLFGIIWLRHVTNVNESSHT